MQVGTVLLFLSILQQFVLRTETVSFEEDVTINHRQKKILDKFKQLVTPILPHEYMKKDIYLIRWLRAREFNILGAESMLRENLAWRRENQIDEIHKQDWSQLRRQYKYWIDGVDKEGRPVMFLDVGEWDLRRGVLSGQTKRISQLVDKGLDEVNVHIRKLQDEGKNVTQYYLIWDLDGYNAVQHNCPACIGLILGLTQSYEDHYPGACHKIVVVNTPAIFQPLLELFRNFANPATRNIMHVYGKNKQGRAALLKDIDKDQLPYEVGGDRILPNIDDPSQFIDLE